MASSAGAFGRSVSIDAPSSSVLLSTEPSTISTRLRAASAALSASCSAARTAVLRDRTTGVAQPLGADPACAIAGTPTGRAVVATRNAVGFTFPAVAIENDLMAMLESEPAQNFCEMNGDGDRADAMAARTMVGRNGTADDLVGLVVFLAGPSAGFVTGQLLHADGGFSAH